ncbi:MAG: hypothetical protein IID33_10880 [Planctomycetes bacterium]|nr:hypothetical protein [Planctomycetota bacterium]
MIKQHRMILSLLIPFVTLAIGCEVSSFPNTLPASLEDVNTIRNDGDLTAAEKRTDLERLGIDAATINAILAGDRTGNQFGGDLESAHAKVTGQRLNDLTADEVQIYADAASEEDSSFDFEITDEEAAATVNLLVENGIASTDALSTFINDPSNVIPVVIPEDFLNNVFLDFDPSLLLDQLP